ncbi:MAG: hydrogenase maturation protease [bacterium]|nr:hydrogenase maturation protease [bacterium]
MAGGRVTIVGCGRTDCGDDGAGVRIGEALRRSDLAEHPGVRILLTESPGIDLIADMEGVEFFVLVDAAQADSDHPAGTWAKLDYGAPGAKLRVGRQQSTHGLSIAEALELAAALGQLPSQVWVYAVFGERFDLGTEASPETTAVLPSIAQMIERHVAEYLDEASCTS